MCRPDDFPPYEEPEEVAARPSAWFRKLDPTEEQTFRAWARTNHQPGDKVSPLWHPVVIDECQRIDAEAGA